MSAFPKFQVKSVMAAKVANPAKVAATAGRVPALIYPTANLASAPVAAAAAAARPSRQRSRAIINRKAMPVIAGVVDAFRRVFGADQVRVIFVEENGLRIGTAPGGSQEGGS